MADSCLVTGATGFIGQHLCRRLQQDGSAVRALVRKQSAGPWDQAFGCELGSGPVPDDVFAGIDTCYHLAGVVHAMPDAGIDERCYNEVNVVASEMLASMAAAAGVKRFIYFSSVKAVADPGQVCVDESWDVQPGDPYGISKREAERRLLAIGKESDMQVIVLRPVLVYGPAVKGNLLRMMRAIDTGRFPPVPDTGNQRSMVGIDDLVDAALHVSKSPRSDGNTYIVSDNAHCSTRQLYEWMNEALERRLPRWSVPVPVLRAGALFGDAVQRVSGYTPPLNSGVLHRLLGSACYRSDKIQQELGWLPRMHIRDCLPAMVEACRAADDE